MPILAKTEVTYMGSSGPGTMRLLKFDDVTLDEKFNIQREKKHTRQSYYPIETTVSLSDKATTVWTTYMSAFNELEAAKAKFDEAKKLFQESDGGREIQSILVPEAGPLQVKAVVSDEDIVALKALVEEQGVTVTHTTCKIEGYSMAIIEFVLSQPFPKNKLEHIKHNDYAWPEYGYCYYKDGTTNMARYINKSGYKYPPYRHEDWKEIQEINRVKEEAMNVKLASKN